MKFLEKSTRELLEHYPDLSKITIVIPGKRPIVFIKKILQQLNYSGFLPKFLTIEELIKQISGLQEINGIALWLFGFEVYRKQFPEEDFSQFLKWFPTILKDWDDILKFSTNDHEVLEFMLDEERIKNWGQQFGEEGAFKKNLNFWKKLNQFFPRLKNELKLKNLATLGMISAKTRETTDDFVQNTSSIFAFLGFNAFTPTEKKLVRTLLQHDKAMCFFHADRYYMEDERQEAGTFLREYKKWKELNENRNFKWIENDFVQPKNITVYEVSGNISQTKILPEILKNINDISKTAIVLLDENLLPSSLDALSSVETLNITMGFALKNLSFSNAIKHVFHLQKQLLKNSSSYYYNDVLPILEEMPNKGADSQLISNFIRKIEERNIVYISRSMLQEYLHELNYFGLLEKQESSVLLDFFIQFCTELKFRSDVEKDDILYESIAHVEKAFRIIKNQISRYTFPINIENLEVLFNRFINSETIDFKGEPLQGLQVMGLLETRLLNFENIIMLSVNEGKLPLGNSQNTYIPFDVRKNYQLNTFIENDSIYAYHFYRLLQGSKNVHLLYNSLSSRITTSEKSRFITQIEMESPHTIKHMIIENDSQPMEKQPITINKTPSVMNKLELWKQRVSVSHLTTYLYNPVDFYFSKVLEIYEVEEMEEELSIKNYGNLIHFALDFLYSKVKGKVLNNSDMKMLISMKNDGITYAIEELKHQPEFYEKGMNFIHKSIATKILTDILEYDLQLIQKGNTLEIVDLERKFENIDFYLDEQKTQKVSLYGYIDRIDRLNGNLRVIDYKTAKTKKLSVKIKEEHLVDYFRNSEHKQAMQLCIYQYVVQHLSEFAGEFLETGIWSFAEASRGFVPLQFVKCDLQDSLISIRNLILEILNPKIPFVEELPDLNKEIL